MAPLDILNAFHASSYGMKSAAPKGDISLSYNLHRTHLILVCKEHAGLGVFPTPVVCWCCAAMLGQGPACLREGIRVEETSTVGRSSGKSEAGVNKIIKEFECGPTSGGCRHNQKRE